MNAALLLALTLTTEDPSPSTPPVDTTPAAPVDAPTTPVAAPVTPVPAATTSSPAPSPYAGAGSPSVHAPSPHSTPSLEGDVWTKFDLQVYGFAELDSIYDTTQSLNDFAQSPVIAKPDSYAGSHGRVTFSARNSRIGLKARAPEVLGLKASGVVEFDFLGNQPGAPNAAISEAAFFANPTARVRHAYLKLESDVVDVIAGQTWNIYGWQPVFFPATVAIQGLPAELFQRTPQIRVEHMFKTSPVNVDVAVAANRPGQRNSSLPDGVGGLRLMLNDWTGYHTLGATVSQLDSASIGVSGLVRRFDVPELAAKPKGDIATMSYGVSGDVFIPVIPASKDNHENALTLMGEVAYGSGTADQYAGFNYGAKFPDLPNPEAATPAPAYAPDIDGNLVSFGKNGALAKIDWVTTFAGAQYFLPGGMFWLSGAVSYGHSPNAEGFGPADKMYNDMLFTEVAAWCDLTSAVRFGVAYDFNQETFVDASTATNHRVIVAGYFIF